MLIHLTLNMKNNTIDSVALNMFDLDLSKCINEKDSLGRRQGMWKEDYRDYTYIWDDSFSIGIYVDDRRQGVWHHFHSDGSLEWVGFYENGIRSGKWLMVDFEDDEMNLNFLFFDKKETQEGESIGLLKINDI